MILPLMRCFIPFLTVYRDTMPFYFPTRLTGKSNRFELVFSFDMGSTAKFIEKTLIRSVNAFQLTLDRLAWQRIPMWMRRLFQLC